MREVKVIAYEAFDGEVFLDKSKCDAYELEQNLIMHKEEIKEEYANILDKVNRLCDVMNDTYEGDCGYYCVNRECPFYSKEEDCGCKLNFPNYK